MLIVETQKIWDLIKQHQGEMFYTVSGKELIYRVERDMVFHNRTKIGIPRQAFEKAVAINPHCPADLQKVVVGPSYVFAIISDPRIQ